jgi:hypothetical protein
MSLSERDDADHQFQQTKSAFPRLTGRVTHFFIYSTEAKGAFCGRARYRAKCHGLTEVIPFSLDNSEADAGPLW